MFYGTFLLCIVGGTTWGTCAGYDRIENAGDELAVVIGFQNLQGSVTCDPFIVDNLYDVG